MTALPTFADSLEIDRLFGGRLPFGDRGKPKGRLFVLSAAGR
jgi:hypothetical protein